MLGSLLPGDCTIVAARTSVGKTKFALNIVDNVASKGHPCHVYSLEMSRARVLGRLWSIHTGCETPETTRQLTGAAYAYADKPVWICDTAPLSASDVAARVRQAEVRPKLVAVDYLGLLDHGDLDKVTEATAIGKTVKYLRAHGRELGYHLLLLCQVNRASVGPGSSGPPKLHHLRGSGDIEQDADSILTLGPGAGNDLHVDVAKNRNTGRTGRVTLRPFGQSCRLEEV
jgi:replicative DNA helicase